GGRLWRSTRHEPSGARYRRCDSANVRRLDSTGDLNSKQLTERGGVDARLGDEIVNQNALVGTMFVEANSTHDDGVHTDLPIQAGIGNARPLDEELRLAVE